MDANTAYGTPQLHYIRHPGYPPADMGTRFEFGAIGAMLSDVRTGDAPNLDTVTIQSVGAALDTDPFSLQLSEPAEIEIVVSPASIERFLNEKKPGGLSNFEVRLHDGQLKVSAALRVIVEIRAEATCNLQLIGNKRIEVELVGLAGPVAGFKGAVEEQLRQINPIFDAAKLSWNAELRSLVVTDKAIVVRGTISPP